MIQAVYYRKYNRLTVEGHAKSGEPGHDLVCASASMLAYTLAANVANIADHGQAIAPIMDLTPGNAEVSCNPISRHKATVTLVFDAVCTGFELLAHSYPENISYQIR